MTAFLRVLLLALFTTALGQKQLCLHSFALRHLQCSTCSPNVNLACNNGQFFTLGNVQHPVKKYIFPDTILESNFRLEMGSIVCEISDTARLLGSFTIKLGDFGKNTFVGGMTESYTYQLKLCHGTENEVDTTSTVEASNEVRRVQRDKTIQVPCLLERMPMTEKKFKTKDPGYNLKLPSRKLKFGRRI